MRSVTPIAARSLKVPIDEEPDNVGLEFEDQNAPKFASAHEPS